ncbi:MAG: M28 family peptidase [Actinomycetota bacterium]|nr:M28 family peptidase [Actinomycetota bacterium]
MRTKKFLVVALAATLAIPALLGSPSVAVGGQRYIDLDKVPKPKITGKQIITGLEEFVDKFPLRQNALPNNVAAAEFLAKEAKKNGFDVKILEFQVSGRTVRVVQALKKGTVKPDEWIAFISHYDVVAGGGVTIQGAYDDGSGTNMMRYFGKAFSDIKTRRTIALLWFDAEENGLLASQAYAEMLKKKKQKITAGLGFDMVGIGYPARYCICIYHGPMPADMAKAVPIIDYVNFDYLKFPKGDGGREATAKWPLGTEGHVCSCGVNIRNSDESNFAEQGYFTMRWTGMRTAADYPGYHQPWDTVPFMEFVAGSRETLEEGTENTFKSAYYTTFVLDNLP